MPTPRFIRPLGLIDITAVLCFFVLILGQMQNFADDPGVGWHLKTGEYIARHGEIPASDPFLAAAISRPWVCDQWLSDLTLFSLYHLGSWPLLYVSVLLLYSATYFLVLYPCTRRLSGTCLGSVLGVFLAFKLGLVHFILRPVVISFLFFILTYTLSFRIYRALSPAMFRSREGLRRALNLRESGLSERGVLIFLPLLFLVWANMHPSFGMGLIVLAILCAALLFDSLLARRAAPSSIVELLRSNRVPLALLLLCSIVTLGNPSTWGLHRSIYALMNSELFMSMHMEWLSPALGDPATEFFIIVAGGIVLLLLLGGYPRWGTFEPLLLLTFFILNLQATRFFPFFGIAAAIPLGDLLMQLKHSRFLMRFPWFPRVVLAFERLEQRETRSYGGGLLVPLGLIFLLLTLVMGRLPLFNAEYGPSSSKYPYAAMDKTRELAALSKQIILAAPAEWGGFIALYGAQNIKAIIDDRNVLLGEEFYRTYFAQVNSSADWFSYFKNKAVTHMLYPPNSPLAKSAREKNLALLFEDQIGALYALQ